jgi:hypothetical protein
VSLDDFVAANQEILPPAANSVAVIDDLHALADRIRAAHQAVGHAAHSVLEHAMAAGDALLKAKAALEHGEWLPWLEHECDLKERTAQNYMALAKARARLAANPQRVAGLGVRGALELIGRRPHSRQHGQASHDSQNQQSKTAAASFDGLAWLTSAPLEERRHAFDGAGSRTIAEAIPPTWNVTLTRNGDGERGRLLARIADLEAELRELQRENAALKGAPQDDGPVFLRDGRPMTADPRKEGIPLFLQTQNREPSPKRPPPAAERGSPEAAAPADAPRVNEAPRQAMATLRSTTTGTSHATAAAASSVCLSPRSRPPTP